MFGLHFSRLGSVNILAPINRALSFISALSNSITPQRGSAATFTRSTTATYVDDSGVIQTAAINTPRFQGGKFLSEPARTNLLVRSQEFDDAAWTKSTSTVSANNTTAPDGGFTADLITSADEVGIYQAVVVTPGVVYTASVFFKKDTCTIYRFRDVSDDHHVVFTVATKSFSSPSNVISYGYQECSNGWFRIWMTYTAVGSTGAHNLRPNSQAGSTSYWQWGAQLEAGNRASSYIPTVASAVTRAADSLTYPVTASTTQGGLSFTIVPAESPSTAATYPNISFLSVSNSNHIGIRADPGNNDLLLFVYAGGSFSFSSVIASITAGSTYKVAVTWSVTGGTLAYSINGGSVTLLTGKTLPSGLNTFKTSDVTWNGQLSDVKVFTQALSDNTLRQLTT